MTEFENRFAELRALVDSSDVASMTADQLSAFKVQMFGRDGSFKGIFALLRDCSPEEKPAFAKKLNELKSTLETGIETALGLLQKQEMQKKLDEQHIDLTLPPLHTGTGGLHPISRIESEIEEVLVRFGFELVEGPEIEDEYYCFDALNIPPHHPARDMQDTFYTDTGHVLRTHTTSVQARQLQEQKPPVKIAAKGRVYRNESVDASHTEMFHQFEMLWVDKGLTLAQLQHLMTQILKELYGKRRKVRFVPKYYPYTEPSIGALISNPSGDGYTTVAGAGMVHWKVLEEFKIDPLKFSGFAFGLGTSRLVSERFGFPNLSAIYENDLRVLKGLA